MKNKLKDNLLIKIFSVVAAIVLWFYIQMVQNPDVDYTFNNMKVQFVNSSVMEENKFVVMDQATFSSDISVRCQRWTLNELKADDFVVYVDLSEVRQAGALELPVKVRLNNENIIITNKNPSTITVNVDRVITAEKPLKIHLSGKPKEGFYTNDKLVTSATNTVTVSGPKSLIDQIENGVVNLDVNNKSADFSETGEIVLTDQNGTAVSNERITLLNGSVSLSVQIYTKKIVPIEVTGLKPQLLYEIKPANVEIAGKISLVEQIESIKVSDFVLRDTEVGYTQEINLTLPENVILLTDVKPQLQVTGMKEE